MLVHRVFGGPPELVSHIQVLFLRIGIVMQSTWLDNMLKASTTRWAWTMSMPSHIDALLVNCALLVDHVSCLSKCYRNAHDDMIQSTWALILTTGIRRLLHWWYMCHTRGLMSASFSPCWRELDSVELETKVLSYCFKISWSIFGSSLRSSHVSSIGTFLVQQIRYFQISLS